MIALFALLTLCILAAPTVSLSTIHLPTSLVTGLDLEPLLEKLGSHCGTKRGRIALLDHCPCQRRVETSRIPSTRRQRLHRSFVVPNGAEEENKLLISEIAQNEQQVEAAYELVTQARELIRNNDCPPISATYGDQSSTQESVFTDDDEWLWDHEDPTEFSLLDIWQAEQVVGRILQVIEWATLHPSFSFITTVNVESLKHLHKELTGSVKVSRVGSADPRELIRVTLNETKFPVLRILGTKKDVLLETERDIELGLAQAVFNCRHVIDNELDLMARLDVIFAKASFGLHSNIPKVSQDGVFSVSGFLHPLVDENTVVPIDLELGGEYRTLVISGPNGGGKSLALKSFGLAAVMLKLAIPFGAGGCVPYFNDVLVSIGDPQSVLANQSTFTAKLQRCSSVLKSIRDSSGEKKYLVLWDELLSGTDESIGFAIGKAMLSELREKHPNSNCVVTTHSPQLKAWSFHDEEVQCASVQLVSSRPSYHLVYGGIGESVGYWAMSTVEPPFSESFLHRVSSHRGNSRDNLNGTDEGDSYVRALTHSLEEQLQKASRAAADATRVKGAMVELALTFERHLERLEQSLQSTYTTLKTERRSEMHDFELVGETLSEVAAVRKGVKTDRELLNSSGLKPLPPDHSLRAGDLVVVIDESSVLYSSTGIVDSQENQRVSVRFASAPWGEYCIVARQGCNDDDDTIVVEFPRHQLAVWDYDSVWGDTQHTAAPSVEKSKRNVQQLLSSIDNQPIPRKLEENPKTNSFTSARERKASRRRKKRR